MPKKLTVPDAPAVFDERGAAEYLGVSAHSLRTWRCRETAGTPPYTSVAGRIRYRKESLDRYLAEREVNP